jgi:RND family efflux transporter MFP subunit
VFDLPLVLVDQLPDDVGFRVSAELTPTVSTTGRVRELAPQANANTRTRRVRLKLDEIPQAFRLGTTISVELSRPVARRSQLPATALLERDGRHLVWVLDTQKLTVALREVEVLGQSAQKVIVGGGLEPGERVVVTGVNSLQPGQRVKFEVDLR